jgi:sugar/nucleoside kinase (ribokinase family)
VYVDSQVSQSGPNHLWYKGADYIFLNDVEVYAAAKLLPKKSRNDLEIGLTSETAELALMLDTNIVYKRGEKGAVLCRKDGTCDYVAGLKVNTVDTCGAGDAFLAAFVKSGNNLDFANKWAAISTTKMGTIVPALAEMEMK